jgi:hypothetical protein
VSATGRNKPGKERDPLDYYPTPGPTIRAILPYLNLRRESAVLDPACGDGSILDEARAWAKCATLGCEIDAGRASAARSKQHLIVTGDALAMGPGDWPACTHIIGNPPFGLMMPFIETSLSARKHVACWLLPIDFVSSDERREFNRKNPSDFHVVKRPSFSGDGDTDAQNYAWFVWPGTGRWRVI